MHWSSRATTWRQGVVPPPRRLKISRISPRDGPWPGTRAKYNAERFATPQRQQAAFDGEPEDPVADYRAARDLPRLPDPGRLPPVREGELRGVRLPGRPEPGAAAGRPEQAGRDRQAEPAGPRPARARSADPCHSRACRTRPEPRARRPEGYRSAGGRRCRATKAPADGIATAQIA